MLSSTRTARPVRSLIVGYTCLRKTTFPLKGTQTRSHASLTTFPMASRAIARKSSTRSDAFSIGRAAPRRTRVIMMRSSATQSSPMPRQSHLKWPLHSSSTAVSLARDSPTFWPSVSRIARGIVAGCARTSSAASASQVLIAVPPFARIRETAAFAATFDSSDAEARPEGGNTNRAVSVPAITAKRVPGRRLSIAAFAASFAAKIFARGTLIDDEQSMIMMRVDVGETVTSESVVACTSSTASISVASDARNLFWWTTMAKLIKMIS